MVEGNKPDIHESITSLAQRERFIAEAYRKGLTDTRSTVGYHGSSKEALQYLLRTGVLPGRTLRKEDRIHIPQISS